MNTAYLLIGGNLGNRADNLKRCIAAIQKECGVVSRQSGVYETAAWGKTNQPSFYNQALELQTEMEPAGLLEHLLAIELQMGRTRTEKMGPRIIDIDILLFNQLVISSQHLQVPHPYLPQRRFALVPLQEIAPRLVHPILEKTITSLLAECKDGLDVHKI